LHKDDQEIGLRESLVLSAGYISVAPLFGAWVGKAERDRFPQSLNDLSVLLPTGHPS